MKVVCGVQMAALQVSGKVKGKISLGSLWRENKKNYTKMEVLSNVWCVVY